MDKDLCNQQSDELMIINISEDKMTATATFVAPSFGGKSFSIQEVYQALNDKGICFGIEKSFFTDIFAKRKYNTPYVIAKGIESVDGKDGRIDMKINLNKNIDLKTDSLGKINFKELNLVKNVKNGDLIAIKEDATEGIEGTNVLGTKLYPRKGKSVAFKNGKNTLVINNALYANLDGQVMMHKGKIIVSPVYHIEGNVDHSTGNIDFLGNVIIEGNVTSGFSVKAKGNIEVRGVVEEANLEATGHILISGGIQGGPNGKLRANEDIVAKFIQNAYLEAGRNIISEALLHSHAIAGNDIKIVTGKGMITGGSLVATNKIEARIIGSNMGTATNVKIGIPSKIYQRLKEIEPEYKQISNDLSEIEKNLNFLLTKKDFHSEKNKIQNKILINKIMKEQDHLMKRFEELHEEYENLHFVFYSSSKGEIKVTQQLYHGVNICMGETERLITTNYSPCFILKKSGEISIFFL